MNTPNTNTTMPQENKDTPDVLGGDSTPKRGDSGPANLGSPAASVMKQFQKTEAERGEGNPTETPKGQA